MNLFGNYGGYSKLAGFMPAGVLPHAAWRFAATFLNALNAGKPFWGCNGFSACKGTREVDAHRLPSTGVDAPHDGSRSQSSQSKSVENPPL